MRYDVRWVLVDSFRLDGVPGFRDWLDAHFHVVENLGDEQSFTGGNGPHPALPRERGREPNSAPLR